VDRNAAHFLMTTTLFLLSKTLYTMKLHGFLLCLTALLDLSLASESSSNKNSVESGIRGRQLAFDWIGGYEPRTLVTDHAAIDLDQAELERLLSDDRKFDAAKAIYEKGGHSQPIARLKLTNPGPAPDGPIPARTIVLGNNTHGETIQGRLVEDVTWAAADDVVFLHVEYEGNHDQESPLNCQVGGLVVDDSGSHEGCKSCGV
jgi:hypothetical protein